MRILSLDSSTESASVAILEDSKLLGEINFNYKKQHSILIMPMIDNLLSNLTLSIDDIDGFVVSKGPGSFTGLRIGMATAKGLSMGTNKPLISISSLDALAYNLYGASGIICPIMDALRGNVYTCIYTFENGTLKTLTDYMAISIDELIETLKTYNKKVYFIGDGTAIHSDFIKQNLDSCDFAPAHLNFAKASSLGELGIKKLNNGSKDVLNTCAPLYLRKSQAEREYDKKMGIVNNG